MGKRAAQQRRQRAAREAASASSSSSAAAAAASSAAGGEPEAERHTADPSWRIFVRPMRGKRDVENDPAFKNMPEECIVNVCSTGKAPFSTTLSPFFVGPVELPWGFGPASRPATALNLENAWQYSKVYPSQADANGEPTDAWYSWAKAGFQTQKAARFPMGRGAKPLYAFGGPAGSSSDAEGSAGSSAAAAAAAAGGDGGGGDGGHERGCVRWGYVESRHRVYAPLYSKCIEGSAGFFALLRLLKRHGKVTLLDYDGWDHTSHGLDWTDVLYYPRKKLGHGFVLAMTLLNHRVWEQPYGGDDLIDTILAKADAHLAAQKATGGRRHSSSASSAQAAAAARAAEPLDADNDDDEARGDRGRWAIDHEPATKRGRTSPTKDSGGDNDGGDADDGDADKEEQDGEEGKD